MAIFRGSGSSLTGSAIDPTEALLDSDFTVNGILIRTASGVYSTTPDNTANWDTAYSWGDWAVGVDKAFVDGLNVDADTLDSQEGSWYQDRTNHTGTQTLSTISDSGTAAAADLTTSATDTTAGRAMKTGLGGLGTVNAPTVADFDTLAVSGFFRSDVSGQAELPDAGNWIVLQAVYDGGSAVQLARRPDGLGPFVRNRGDADWDLMYHQSNILGTVSQSSGVPTGAIIEQGSNSNGEYTKFADGTMLCFVNGLSVGTFSSAYYIEGTWTFPASFVSTPEGLLFNIGVAGGNASAVRKVAGISNAGGSASGTDIRIASVSGNDWVSGDTITGVAAQAVGRWF